MRKMRIKTRNKTHRHVMSLRVRIEISSATPTMMKVKKVTI